MAPIPTKYKCCVMIPQGLLSKQATCQHWDSASNFVWCCSYQHIVRNDEYMVSFTCLTTYYYHLKSLKPKGDNTWLNMLWALNHIKNAKNACI